MPVAQALTQPVYQSWLWQCSIPLCSAPWAQNRVQRSTSYWPGCLSKNVIMDLIIRIDHTPLAEACLHFLPLGSSLALWNLWCIHGSLPPRVH